MTVKALDHVNIRTARLGEMVAFYSEVLGMRPGARPPFTFNGAWLYCGERAAVHLVEVSRAPQAGEPRIGHFAFQAVGLADFLTRLRGKDIACQVSVVPDLDLRQVFLHDPDGNQVEVTFAAEETADLADFPADA
jgi:catechol 2,3-dioxygenase-like lactoylglutathione lyase family enzyme